MFNLTTVNRNADRQVTTVALRNSKQSDSDKLDSISFTNLKFKVY